MLSRSSIFNFKLFQNAGFWALLIVIILEYTLQSPLRKRFFVHHVDNLALKLDTQSYDAPTLILGDSVAENVFKRAQGQDHRFAVFASNQAIEMTGQYFFTRRYLRNNPAPGSLILMAGTPFYGDLDQIFTENYIQRVFTHWGEIGWMAKHTLDPVFILKSLSYKFSPSYRYRNHLKEGVFPADKKSSNTPTEFTPPPQKPWSLSRRIRNHWRKLRGQNASHRAWEKLLRLTGKENIQLIFIPSPTVPGGIPQSRNSVQEISAFEPLWPQLEVWKNEIITFPDSYFYDGTHFNKKGYVKTKPYQDKLYHRILRAGNLHEQKRKSETRLNMNDLWEREKLSMPSPFKLEEVYPLEGRRRQAFQWTKPTFTIQVRHPGTLLIETSKNTPRGKLEVKSESYQQTFELRSGVQQIEIPVEEENQTIWFSYPEWSPGNGDKRKLGIALKALGLRR